MSVTKWVWINFTDNTKGHCAPASLHKSLIIDLQARDCGQVREMRPTTEMFLDQPGMVAMGRPVETYHFYGLTLGIPSEDCAAFLQRLQKAPLRQFPIGSYYKLHGCFGCIVLRPVHKLALELQMTTGLEAAEQRALAFYADRQTHADILREANARAARVPVEKMPDYSSAADRRIDRFVPKERGQA